MSNYYEYISALFLVQLYLGMCTTVPWYYLATLSAFLWGYFIYHTQNAADASPLFLISIIRPLVY
jgi:hypothetical protein